MFNEFRQFIMKGNVLDLAVGVIIGGAFGAIVSSMVGDILMPLIGVLTGGLNFSALSVLVGSAEVKYGAFIQAIINFLIIGFVLFMIVRTANRLKKQEEAQPAPPPGPTKEEQLLAEIRDLLRDRR